jgi:hypothetical protein
MQHGKQSNQNIGIIDMEKKICLDNECSVVRNKLYEMWELLLYLRKLAQESNTPEKNTQVIEYLQSLSNEGIYDLFLKERQRKWMDIDED